MVTVVKDFKNLASTFLMQDPHYFGVPSEAHVLDSFVKWHDLKLFDSASFYNFGVPVNPE